MLDSLSLQRADEASYLLPKFFVIIVNQLFFTGGDCI